jgi:hypothetical protein
MIEAHGRFEVQMDLALHELLVTGYFRRRVQGY